MTPDQKVMAIWGGGMAAALLAGWITLDIEGDTIADKEKTANELHAKYANFYPDQGKPIEDAIKEWQQASKKQVAELKDAEARLVQPIPLEYREVDMTASDAQRDKDMGELKSIMTSRGIKHPKTLPGDGMMSENLVTQAIDLVKLCLLRKVLDRCIADGITDFVSLKPGTPECDPSTKYAVFTLEVGMETDFSTVDRLLQDMKVRQASEGFGIHTLKLVYSGSDKKGFDKLKADVTFSLLIPNPPSFGLTYNAEPAPGDVPKQGTGNRFQTH